MIFAADIGNTNIVLGIFPSDNSEDKEIITKRIPTDNLRKKNAASEFLSETEDFINENNLKPEDISGSVVSSVVLDVTDKVTDSLIKIFGKNPVIITSDIKSNIEIIMPDKKELGPDRLVNCAAAEKLYGAPFIVIDYGTANTYDAVNSQNQFVTGITTAGILTRTNALVETASMLDSTGINFPKSIIANTTATSLEAGAVFGTIGETEYIVKKIKEHLGDMKVIGTGGLSRLISEGTDIFDIINPNLTMEGLRILYLQNSADK